jgi:hypothetical protein
MIDTDPIEENDMAETDTGTTGALTDGTGIGTFTAPKVLKDLIVDIALGVAAGLAAVQITEIPQNTENISIAAFAIGKAIIQALYRAVLKWGQTP